MKRVTILGCTGSIGMQAMDVVRNHPDDFELVGLSCGHQIEKLRTLLDAFYCPYVCVMEEADAKRLAADYPNIQFGYGKEGLLALCRQEEADIVLNGIVGFAGLEPSLAAIEAGKDLALANKETMVVGGSLVTRLAKEKGVRILPVDSEHSAIFQCLQGEDHRQIKRLIITASGGAFRDLDREELKGVTKEQALKHPNWSMGNSITIDSATMFNKGLEVIEAKWLFDLPLGKISVIMHPESIVHSMVEFVDGAVMAQMGTPDMRLPIQYALTYPDREPIANSHALNLEEVGQLTFRKMDFERFPALGMAYDAGGLGGTRPAVLNAAKEVATQAFLSDEISFLEIEECVADCLKHHRAIEEPTLDDLVMCDLWARRYVRKRIGESASADNH